MPEETSKKTTSSYFQLPDVNPTLVNVYCGGAGANAAGHVITKVNPQDYPHLKMLVIESNASVLRHHFQRTYDDSDPYTANLFKWFESDQLKILPIGKGFGAGGDPKEGAKIFKDQLDGVIDFFNDANSIVQMGGAGGGTASGIMPIVAETAGGMKNPISIYSLLAYPRFDEGHEKLTKAARTRDQLLEICPTTVAYNERINSQVDANLPLSTIYQHIDEAALYPILRLTRWLSQETGDVQDLDPSDWNNYLATGNYPLPGYFDASNGLEGMEEALLGNRYLDTRIIEKAIKVMFIFRGASWTYGEQEKVKAFVRSKMKSGIHDSEIEIKSGVKEQGLPEGEKTVGFIAFAKEGPDKVEMEDHRSKVTVLELPKSAEVLSEAIPEAISNPEVPAQIPAVIQSSEPVAKKKISGSVDGKGRETAYVDVELAASYDRLFVKELTYSDIERAKEIQNRIHQQTGLLFNIPIPALATNGSGRGMEAQSHNQS